MTPEKQEQKNQMFHYFQLEDLVPQDHILRQIDKLVDFSFVRSVVKDCYCPNNGRPGVDPELIVRMLLIGYLYNLSENRLCQEVAMHAEKRLFCHMTSFEDKVPDRSTINKLRNHRWAESGLFQKIMQQIVRQCIDVGLVGGWHFSVDGTQIHANASVKSIEPIEPPVSLDDYLTGIGLTGKNNTSVRKPFNFEDKDFHGKQFSNETHRSITDPDAKLYKKSKGKEASLSYIGNDLIDTKSRVIIDTVGSIATGTAECEAALEMFDNIEIFMLPCNSPTVATDKGYGSGSFIAALLDKGITPHIPLRAGIKLEPLPRWKNKTNNPIIQAKRDKKISDVHARNYVRLISETDNFKLSQKLRKRSEHIFAEAKQCHGMDQARYRGLDKLQEQLYLTATVQNLKRLVSFMKKKNISSIMAKIHLNVPINKFLSPLGSYVNIFFRPFLKVSVDSLYFIFFKPNLIQFWAFNNLTLSHDF